MDTPVQSRSLTSREPLGARLRTRAAPEAYRLCDLSSLQTTDNQQPPTPPHPSRSWLRPASLQGISNLGARGVICACPARVATTRSWQSHPCQLRRTYLLPLLQIRLQPQSEARALEEFGLLLPGRWPDIQASSKRLHRSVFAAQSCGPSHSHSSHTLMHSARAKPAVRKYQLRRHPHGPVVAFPGARDNSRGTMWR